MTSEVYLERFFFLNLIFKNVKKAESGLYSSCVLFSHGHDKFKLRICVAQKLSYEFGASNYMDKGRRLSLNFYEILITCL